MQDTVLDLFDAGKLDYASAVSLSLSPEGFKRFYDKLDFYKKRVVIRPEAIANFSEIVRRLGVVADWKKPYTTMAPEFEAEEVKVFGKMFEKGYIYKGLKPVYWCNHDETALAEAEIEYKSHVSPSIWVAFSQIDAPEKNFVIWTTTPWTIPANMAVAVHPELEYVEIAHAGKTFIVADALADKFIADCGLEGATRVAKVLGKTLEGIQTQHPICDRTSPVVCADYITTDAGTVCATASKFTARSTTKAFTPMTDASPRRSSVFPSWIRTASARPISKS